MLILVGVASVLGFSQLGFTISQSSQLGELKSLLLRPTPKPVVIVQSATSPTPILLSRTGILKAAYQLSGITSSTPISHISPISPITPIPQISRYILLTNIDQITFLTVPENLDLTAYINQNVLITGEYDSVHNTLQIRNSSGIELLP